MKCSEEIACSLLDFDSSNNRCRLFLFGSIIPSSSSSSRVGSVRYSVNEYSKYNETCERNGNEINRYLICGSNNRYECSSTFFWNGTMCSSKKQ